MAIAALPDAMFRAHVLDETKWKMTLVASSEFGFE
jgi:hypothetical protein